jgi:small subunit ribosomal protein S13
MPRLLGVNIPDQKRVDVALTYLYGIGRKNVVGILKRANINPAKRAKELTSDDLSKLQKIIETMPVEGVLRKIVTENIKQLRQISSYRGLRHAARLPVRGQRTRSNARTKRGKKVTIGAMKKEALQKTEAPAAAKTEAKK